MGFWRPFPGLVAIARRAGRRRGVESTVGRFVASSLFICLLAVDFANLPSAFALEPPRSTGRVATFEIDRITLHTDVPRSILLDELVRLDRHRQALEAYWDQPLKGKLACYWVIDPAVWPERQLPPEAREKLQQKSAVTLTERTTLDEQVVSIRSTVYSSWKPADLQHELVHAYCWQTFGRCGPAWYAEGIAEVFANAGDASQGVQYQPQALDFLRSSKNPPTAGQVTGDDLPQQPLWQTYAQRWALCYLLMHHPRYAEKFRQYGQAVLRGASTDLLEQVQISGHSLTADYHRFLRELAPGYRFPDVPGDEPQAPQDSAAKTTGPAPPRPSPAFPNPGDGNRLR